MEEESIVNIDAKLLRQFMFDSFVKLGVPAEDANICADVLIASDLRGIASHGVQRLKMYFDRIKSGYQEPVTNITIVKESPTTATLDAGHGMGHVAAYRAMELAIKKAKEFGTGAVAVGNSTHYGIAGYYPMMAIKEGMIGMAVTNARPSIAPTFGIEPMMGTNPLTFGLPTDEEFPFVIDCATSITQRGKIEVLSRTETPIPKGWVINEDGSLATDPVKILKDLTNDKAALLPLGGDGELLGGHKGYGYAALVEILSAALSGGPFMKDLTLDKGYKLGHFFLAIDVSKFIDPEIFKNIAGSICRSLRNSKKAPGQNRIYTAGEKEFLMEQKLAKEGIPINKSIQKDLLTIKKELGLNQYDFPF
ncbi:MAG: Ldh family oxidoreductase [Candidatus Heimdallarchaeota archaeon]|nr:Ldh family oxidoreductase [Candidatus Heimdallarchaeota archaeon]